ncbi:MAG: Jag N-terminal domain-containing protein [Chloroflexi bacterium]|nr:Jag N-terminal domain-containing protein [Chloroflexota bacterium]
MNNSRATLEVIAKSVEEAIEKGLADLGLPPEAVEITVLDEGGSGILGLGSRQARVRISILAEGGEEKLKEDSAPIPAGDKDQTLSLTEEIVSELLEKMNLEASVEARYGEESDNLPHAPILVDISGSDLSILIGRQAKTLNALQYITRLILGKELEHGIPLSIDVEGYRDRRELQVRQLARRVADQVADTQREQALEPMPPNERRFAHIELQDEPRVYTESFGLEPQRKVIIYPSE